MKKFLILLVVFMVLLDQLAPISSAPAAPKKKVTKAKGKATTKKAKDVIKIEKTTTRKPKTTKTTTQAPAKKALQYGLSGCVNNADCLTNYCMITQFGGFCRCGFGSWSTTLNACSNFMVEGDSCYVDNNYSNNNSNDFSNENNSGNSKGWNSGRKKRSGYNSDGYRHLCNTALGLNCQAGFCRCSYGTWNGQKCA
ncbi:unnamed protein product [Brachionus calyciflorus]|uniref:EGF-like domain-containing protein n=1 Tax=Brachionus calyciflorus TaxID=104777 RepID=A0A813WJW0_9BILA|nr:unnamed protein product [Brachionus calyciflorus]